MKISIMTLFPEMIEGFFNDSIIKRAIEKKIVEIELINPRDYSLDKHHHVDDTPYGGGAGMVLACPSIFACHEAISKPNYTILLTPQGHPYKQKDAERLKDLDHLVLICGHYEGFDERIRTLADEQISIGDYILTGGEIAAVAISDSIIRLLDGAITKESAMDDSFSSGLLEYPQYTKPPVFNGMEVPSVLLNGNHELIRKYRLKEALRKTYLNRPDLLESKELTAEEAKMLKEIKEEI